MSWIPQVLTLMPDRRYHLAAAIAGLQATGVPLVGRNGSTLGAVGWGDSPGLYFFVPLLARATGLSLDGAVLLFFGGILALALAAGIVGWLLYARTHLGRALGVVALTLVCYWSLRLGDDYTLLTALPVAAVPALLALQRRGAPFGRWAGALAATGLVAGLAGLVRVDAALPLPVFAAALTLARAGETRARRALLLAILVCATVLPGQGMRLVERGRDQFLARAVPGYVPPMHTHVLWHSVYIGLGFLENEYGLRYKDGIAVAFVDRVRPGTPVYTAEYDAVLRREVLRLALHDPAFVGKTVMAKVGILAFYLLVFGNVGLVAARRARKPGRLDLSFAAAGLTAALPGLLAIPRTQYLEGFIALTILYALVSIDWALMARERDRARPAPPRPRDDAAPAPALAGVP